SLLTFQQVSDYAVRNWPPDAVICPAFGRSRDVVLSVHVTFSTNEEARTAMETLQRNGGPNASGTEPGIGYIDGMECTVLFCRPMVPAASTGKAFPVRELIQAREEAYLLHST
ncbi:unnamed protein product, partial [Ascophyllum nodosum]